MKRVLQLLPQDLRTPIDQALQNYADDVEEIRLRVGKKVEITVASAPRYPSDKLFTKAHAEQFMAKLSDFSLYALEEELKRGYVTIKGGHRVGIAGKVITQSGRVKLIRDVASFNIRIAKQKVGVAGPIARQLQQNNHWISTLIIGSPQTGKTTLLRDLARMVSLGEGKLPAMKTAIVDERSEIAACLKGVPQNELGDRVDVLDACPKAEGMMMMIRSMSPDVLIVDEIGREEDSEALLEAMNAGVTVFATVHGHTFSEIAKRPMIRPLLDVGIFYRFIELKRHINGRRDSVLLNPSGQPIHPLQGVRV